MNAEIAVAVVAVLLWAWLICSLVNKIERRLNDEQHDEH
jgi:hypothetical protein